MKSKKLSKRLISIALICMMLLSAVVLMASCKENVGGGETQPSPDVSNDGELEVIDYGGESVDFYLWSDGTLHDIENLGSAIPQATYLRNSKVENLYNVKFNYRVEACAHTPTAFAKWMTPVDAMNVSGERSFDIVGGYTYELATASVNGYYADLGARIDFSKDWWPNDYTEAAMMNNRVFVCMGNIDTSFYDNNFAVFYNKDIAADEKLTDMPELVAEGKWTLEKLIEYSKLGKDDVNGDGAMDLKEDQYGYITSSSMGIDTFFNSCNVIVSKRDDNGVPMLLLDDTTHYVAVQQKVAEFVKDPNYVAYGLSSDAGETAKMFGNGQGLFLCDKVGATHNMRQTDYSVLPLPKWSEEQEGYITYNAISNSTGYVVPISSDSEVIEMCTTVLDALSYWGWKELKPIYYDKVVKSQYANDEDWGPMMDIVFENVTIEFTQFYSMIWGNQKAPSMMLRQVTRGAEGEGNFSSAWENNRGLFVEKLNVFLEKYGSVGG